MYIGQRAGFSADEWLTRNNTLPPPKKNKIKKRLRVSPYSTNSTGPAPLRLQPSQHRRKKDVLQTFITEGEVPGSISFLFIVRIPFLLLIISYYLIS